MKKLFNICRGDVESGGGELSGDLEWRAVRINQAQKMAKDGLGHDVAQK
jgi:hypothetical protein